MNLLASLWLIASLLAVISLLLMSGLIVTRWVRDLRRAAKAERRRELQKQLLARDGRGTDAVPGPSWPLLIESAAELAEDAATPAEREWIVARARDLGIPRRLRRDLHSRSAHARSVAATLLATFPDAETRTDLINALCDRDKDVRLAAALSLARLACAPPAGELVSKLGLGTAERSSLVTALFHDIAAVHPEQIAAVIEDRETPAAARMAAIDSISTSRDSRLVGVLIELTRRAAPDTPELPHYLEELGEIGDPSAGPVVALWFDSAGPVVRAAAIQAAGRLQLSSAVPLIAPSLGDADWWVRFRAGEALATLGPDGRQILAETAARGEPVARAAAAIALAERGLPP